MSLTLIAHYHQQVISLLVCIDPIKTISNTKFCLNVVNLELLNPFQMKHVAAHVEGGRYHVGLGAQRIFDIVMIHLVFIMRVDNLCRWESCGLVGIFST